MSEQLDKAFLSVVGGWVLIQLGAVFSVMPLLGVGVVVMAVAVVWFLWVAVGQSRSGR